MSTKTVEQKHRTFWIDEVNKNDCYDYKPQHWDQCIQVIEYSALESAREEIKARDEELYGLRLFRDNVTKKNDYNFYEHIKVQSETIKDLQSKLEKAERENESLKKELNGKINLELQKLRGSK